MRKTSTIFVALGLPIFFNICACNRVDDSNPTINEMSIASFYFKTLGFMILPINSMLPVVLSFMMKTNG